jgi:hypothetical protein
MEASGMACDLARALGDSSIVATAGIQAGNALLASGEYVQAHEYFLKALLSALGISDSMSSSQAYSAWADCFTKSEILEKAVVLRESCRHAAERAGPERKAYLLNQWGNAFSQPAIHRQPCHLQKGIRNHFIS